MSNKFNLLEPVTLPEQSRINHLYKSVNLADAFAILLSAGASNDPARLARFIVSNQPPWIGYLVKVRDAIVVAFGLKTAKNLASMAGDVNRVGVFRIKRFARADHSLRPIRLLFNNALKRFDGLLSLIYGDIGRVLVSYADGLTEPIQASRLLESHPGCHAEAVGADKAYDMRECVANCRIRNITLCLPRNVWCWGGNAVYGRTTRHGGYGVGQTIHACIEGHIGRAMMTERIRETMYRALRRVDHQFIKTMAASSLCRVTRMLFAVRQRGAG